MAGAGSGMLAALVTQPFDVLKTRKQVFQQPPPGLPALNTATGIAFKSKLKFSINTVIPSAPNSTSMSIPRHLVHIVRTEGLKALFSGVGPRTLKIAPACGMMLGCYEGVGRFFGEGEKWKQVREGRGLWGPWTVRKNEEEWSWRIWKV
jgi:solute carrier family 25 protein 39/40